MPRVCVFDALQLGGQHDFKRRSFQGLVQTHFSFARLGHQRHLGAREHKSDVVSGGHKPTAFVAAKLLKTAGGPKIHGPILALVTSWSRPAYAGKRMRMRMRAALSR